MKNCAAWVWDRMEKEWRKCRGNWLGFERDGFNWCKPHFEATEEIPTEKPEFPEEILDVRPRLKLTDKQRDWLINTINLWYERRKSKPVGWRRTKIKNCRELSIRMRKQGVVVSAKQIAHVYFRSVNPEKHQDRRSLAERGVHIDNLGHKLVLQPFLTFQRVPVPEVLCGQA